MWYIALQASKGVFPWKGEVGWNRVVCHKGVTGYYLRNSLGAEQFVLAGMY